MLVKTFLIPITLLCAVSASLALAARPPDVGPGDHGNETPDYGDLFILHRDPSGIPILDLNDCQQPIASPALSSSDCPECTVLGDGSLLLPVDPATCAVVGEYAPFTQEVDFGRINEVRAPDSVLEQQLDDVTIKLATAGCVTLDPAGRLVTSSLVDGVIVNSEIDSPLQNIAIYEKLMREGSLGDGLALPASWIDMAARSLGAAADKTGAIGVDMVVYLNDFLGLTDESRPAMLDRVCINVRQEVTGEVRYVRKCFLDYSLYGYDRGQNFMTLPAPPYIPGNTPQAGWFEYLAVVFNTDPVLFEIAQGPIVDAVPALWSPGPPTSDIGAFATAADDTRAVIEFMHNWPVPGDYATLVPCGAVEVDYYDVSISGESGLQVPKRMVAGTEGREGTVTVQNSGPAEASGTVMVVGVDSDGNRIGPLYAMQSGVPTTTELFVMPEPFTLQAGYSMSWTFFFSMDYATEITWTATVQAPLDANTGNNQVTSVTTVTGSKGGGGGGGGHSVDGDGESTGDHTGGSGGGRGSGNGNGNGGGRR